MPAGIAIPAIENAIRAILVADGTLTGLLASKPSARGGGPAIYDDGDVPSGALMPYLTIGAWTQIPFNSFAPDTSGYGANCTGQIKAIGQRSEDQLFAVMHRVFVLFPEGTALTVSGYSTAWADEFTLQPTLKSTLAGVVTYEVPAIVRVYACDP